MNKCAATIRPDILGVRGRMNARFRAEPFSAFVYNRVAYSLIFPVLSVLLAVLALWLPLRLPWLDPRLP